MPFKSESQRRYMFAKHPKIAKKWADEYPNQGKLPKYKKKTDNGFYGHCKIQRLFE